MRRKMTEFCTLKSSNSTVAGGVGFWRGFFFFLLVVVAYFCGRYAQKRTPCVAVSREPSIRSDIQEAQGLDHHNDEDLRTVFAALRDTCTRALDMCIYTKEVRVQQLPLCALTHILTPIQHCEPSRWFHRIRPYDECMNVFPPRRRYSENRHSTSAARGG